MKKIKTTCLFLCSSIILFSQGMQLSIPIEAQIKAQWCWAASAKMIDNHFRRGGPTLQCSIATQYLNSISPIYGNNCTLLACSTAPTASQNQNNIPLFHDGVFQGMSRVLSMMGYFSSLEFGSVVTWDRIVEEIKHCRPIIAFISNNGNEFVPGHVIVIYGYKTDATGQYVLVMDPRRCPSGVMPYTEINFTNAMSPSFSLRLVAFQTKISPRSEPTCDPCTAERMPIDLPEPIRARSVVNEDFVRIENKILVYDEKILNKSGTYYDFELFENYYPEQKLARGFQVVNGKEYATDVKKAEYPPKIVAKMSQTRDVILSYNGKDNTVKYSVVRAPLPYSEHFYSFKDPSNPQRTYFLSTEPIYDPEYKKLIFAPHVAYHEGMFNIRIKGLTKQITKYKYPAEILAPNYK